MHPSIRRRMTESVMWHKVLGHDGEGDVLHAEPVQLSCYREGKIEMVRNLDGEEGTSMLRLYIYDDQGLPKASDHIDVDGTLVPIIAAQPYQSLRGGPRLVVIYL